jgi:hypothetical protein
MNLCATFLPVVLGVCVRPPPSSKPASRLFAHHAYWARLKKLGRAFPAVCACEGGYAFGNINGKGEYVCNDERVHTRDPEIPTPTPPSLCVCVQY